MEWITIAHDAVKIGLGAAIGGGFTLLTTNLASKRKREENLVDTRRERLLEITKRFSRLHTLFTNQWASQITAFALEHDEAEGAQQLNELIEEELFENQPVIYKGICDLHELEAELCLLGAPSIADMLEQYRFLATSLGEYPEEAKTTDKEAVMDFQQKALVKARTDFMINLMAFFHHDKD